MIILSHRFKVSIEALTKVIDYTKTKDNANLSYLEVMEIQEDTVEDNDNLLCQPFYLPTNYSMELKMGKGRQMKP